MPRRMTPSHPARVRFAGACALLAGLSAAALAPTTVAAATVAATGTGRPQPGLHGLGAIQLPNLHLPLRQLAAFGSGVTAAVEHLRDSVTATASAVGGASGRSRAAVARPAVPRAVTTFTVNSTADDPNASATSKLCRATNGKCTLRAAVTAADNLNKAVIVKLPAAAIVLSDTTAGTMTVTDAGALTIEGVSPAKTVISVKSGDSIEPFAVNENAKSQSGVLFLSGLTVRDGSAAGGGALALLSQDATAVLTDVTLESNAATSGGAIFLESGHLWLTDSTVSGNKAISGGGIAVAAGTISLADSSIIGNSAKQSAGGLFVTDGTATIAGGTVSFNSAGTSSTAGDGGGIALVDDASLSLSGTKVDSNTVRHDGQGGGIIAVASGIDMQGGQLSHNSAAGGGAGGAALLENVEATLSNVTADSNTGAIGGIAAVGMNGVTSTLDILGGSISHNTSEAVLAFGETAGSSVSLDIVGTVLDSDTTTTSAEIPCGSAVCAAASAGGAFQLTLARDTIENDSAHASSQLGGAIEVIATEGGSGSADLQGDTVDYDSAAGLQGSAGAALMASVANLSSTPHVYSPLAINVTGSTFEHDSVGGGGDGGAIGITTGTSSGDEAETSLVMSGDTFEHDSTGTPSSSADNYGGALAIAPGTTGSIADSTFSNNSALGHKTVGGAILDEDEAVFAYVGDSFTSNSAGVGGGLVVESISDTITQCSFSHNKAVSGAAALLFVESVFSITDSTFSAGSVSEAGGLAGGIEVGIAEGSISNSTISGNSAGKSGDGGGIALFDSLVAFDSDTITSNHAKLGSGLYTEGAGQYAAIRDSIISHNTTKATGGSENDCALSTASGEIAVAATSEGGNVLGSAKCVLQVAPSDKISVNPKLAPLANNGGPTETMALEAGSPALKIALACLPTDQRGKARPATSCDSGAYELTKA